jgi:hypothetical protein
MLVTHGHQFTWHSVYFLIFYSAVKKIRDSPKQFPFGTFPETVHISTIYATAIALIPRWMNKGIFQFTLLHVIFLGISQETWKNKYCLIPAKNELWDKIYILLGMHIAYLEHGKNIKFHHNPKLRTYASPLMPPQQKQRQLS